MKRYIIPNTLSVAVELQQMIADSFTKLTEDVTEPRAKGLDFFTEEETAEKNEYHVYSLWED